MPYRLIGGNNKKIRVTSMIDGNISLTPLHKGYIGTFNATKPFSKGKVSFAPEGDKFEGLYRRGACFTRPFITDKVEDIPPETQNLLCKKGKVYTIYYFVAENGCRCSFEGGKDPSLVLETGDDNRNVSSAILFLTISGEDICALFKDAAEILSERFENVKLLKDKILPAFIDKIGFCTYNAFYDKISKDILCVFLRQMNDKGQKIGFILLDDGWISSTPVGAMKGFDADKVKFPDGLKGFSDTVKKEFGLSDVIVWHTFMGYWTGLDPASFGDYELKRDIFDFSDTFKGKRASAEYFPINTMGDFYPENLRGRDVCFAIDLFHWYRDYYKFLRDSGISGTKIDAIGWIEVVNRNNGGRVEGAKKFIGAAQSAGKEYLSSNNLFCSCNTNDFFFSSGNGNLIRTSEDYMPDDVQSHGDHIFYNAHAAMWMGEFFVCDFDMFQSGNTCGDFHAVARAISGGPVYFTDNPKGISYDILKTVATAEGDVPRLISYPRLTEDCLFKKPKDGFIKMFNEGKNSLVLGIFNCVNEDREESVNTEFLSDNARYAAYSFLNGFIGVVEKGNSIPEEMHGLTADVISFVPISNGIAVIGEKGKIIPAEFTDSSAEGDILKVSCIETSDIIVYSERNTPSIFALPVKKDEIKVIDLA